MTDQNIVNRRGIILPDPIQQRAQELHDGRLLYHLSQSFFWSETSENHIFWDQIDEAKSKEDMLETWYTKYPRRQMHNDQDVPLPEPVNQLALKRWDDDHVYNEELIVDSFCWRETPEGSTFWVAINNAKSRDEIIAVYASKYPQNIVLPPAKPIAAEDLFHTL